MGKGSKNRINRFDTYDPNSSLSDPEKSGLVNSETDFELGTPSLSRSENVTFVTSSSTKELILVSLKWRPCSDLKSVCLLARFQLELNSIVYKHEQVVVYRPTFSHVKPGRILQYGSSESCLKFIIAAPYRRARLIFRGQMHNEDSPEDLKFVCCNLTVHPTSGLFDFLQEVGKSSKSTKRHDRHEQLVQIKCEYSISNNLDETKLKGIIYTWGQYSRHFFHDNETERRASKRIFMHLYTGTVFHLCHFDDPKETSFGYFAEDDDCIVSVLNEPYEVDWANINENLQEFGVKIRLNKKITEWKAKRLSPVLFSLETEGRDKGWSYLSINDAIDTSGELEAMEQARVSYFLRLDENRLVRSYKFEPSEQGQNPLVLSVADMDCCCNDLVGSKAASLAQLRTYSGLKNLFVVSHAFVLTRVAYERLLDHDSKLSHEIAELERYLGYGKLSDLKERCENLQRQFEETNMPDDLRNKLISTIGAHYENNSLEGRSFAVRSSSWGEDEQDMSAAGQLSTVLGVQGVDAILKSVMICFASKFTYTNVEYKRQHGLNLTLPMAVVIQEMVECDKAGILFTCEPSSGNDSQMIITANYGLGESVVSGQAEPDSIIVKISKGKEPCIGRIDIGKKQTVVNSDSLKGGDNTGNQYDKSRCCLNDEEILRLAKCGLAIASYFQSPRDIEWGYKGDQLYLFQARPITGLERPTEFDIIHENDQPTRREIEPCTRANVGEVLPYPLTPFTLTLTMKSCSLFNDRLSKVFTDRSIKRFSAECTDAMQSNSCHLFMFLARQRSLLMHSRDRSGNKSILEKAFEVGLFGHELDNQVLNEVRQSISQPKNAALLKFMFMLSTLPFRMNPIELVLKERRKLLKIRDEFPELEYTTEPKDDQLLNYYEMMNRMIELLMQQFRYHGISIMIANFYNGNLITLLSKYIEDPTQIYTALSKFLAVPKVLSAEIPKCIDEFSQMIKAKGKIELREFMKMSPKEALAYIQDDTILTKELAVFLDKFGHRSYNEFEYATKPWRENPEEVAEMIRKNCASGQRKTVKDTKTNDEIIKSLNLNMSKKDEWLLRNVHVPNSQLFVTVRELTKDTIVLQIDLVRRATRLIAEELKRRLRIPDVDLFYYLNYDEIEPLLREPQPSIVFQAARRRQQFKISFKDIWLFDEIEVDRQIIPNHLKERRELDESLLNAPKLYGTPASSGRVQSKVCVVTKYSELSKVEVGDILVAHSTDVGFSPVFPLLSGIVTEVGGIISHGAVIAREYGLPSVLGVPEVTRILKDGQEVILDADKGVIIRLNM